MDLLDSQLLLGNHVPIQFVFATDPRLELVRGTRDDDGPRVFHPAAGQWFSKCSPGSVADLLDQIHAHAFGALDTQKPPCG